MSRPLLSIVIPTCDRPDTLVECLKSLAGQGNRKIEIVVQDNASGNDTGYIIRNIADPRVVHHRCDTRVSMRENFERGVAAATGEYITIIGDDDSFCKGALDWIVDMLDEHRPDALRWRLAAYYWPSMSMANIGFFWLHYDYFYGGWQFGENATLRKRLLASKMAGLWESLQVYHGAVSRTLYETTKSKLGGVFFKYHIPDVFVHTAMLLTESNDLKGWHINVDHPLSIYGLSSHSNGSSWYAGKGEDRGESSPIAQWTKTATSDTQVRYAMQTPIRSMKYHDYVALMLAVDYGLVTEREIDHEAWQESIHSELRDNLWQLSGFVEAVPALDYESRVIGRVLQEFKDELDRSHKEPERLKPLYPECWRYRQMCPAYVIPGAPDHVGTAVEALDMLVTQRIGLARTGPLTSLIAEALREEMGVKIHEFYDANPPGFREIR